MNSEKLQRFWLVIVLKKSTVFDWLHYTAKTCWIVCQIFCQTHTHTHTFIISSFFLQYTTKIAVWLYATWKICIVFQIFMWEIWCMISKRWPMTYTAQIKISLLQILTWLKITLGWDVTSSSTLPFRRDALTILHLTACGSFSATSISTNGKAGQIMQVRKKKSPRAQTGAERSAAVLQVNSSLGLWCTPGLDA